MGCDCPICLHRRGPPYHHVTEEEKQPLSLELPFKLKEYGSPPPLRLDAPPLQRTLVKEAAPTISSKPPWDIIAGGICMSHLGTTSLTFHCTNLRMGPAWRHRTMLF